ncbi:MAG TPA: ATP-binding protein [Actinomycetota bacterium]|nr:ATP-binding protein [Actinomycetota bacterium]
MQTRSVADKASLSGLRRSIRADLSHAGVDPSLAFDCLVAVTEACTQALTNCHGDDDEPAVSWTLDSTSVRFDVAERACTRAVSRAAHPSGGGQPAGEVLVPDLPLALMRSLMDEVQVSQGPSGRIVSLTKLLS